MSALQERMRSLFDLSGSVAVVTGGGRGIGRSLAAGLAGAGAEVVLCGRTPEPLAATADELAAEGARVWWKTADVSREEDVAALAAAVLERSGRVDVLVNNAGINPIYRAAEETSEMEWRSIIDINLTGTFLCCRHFGTAMLARQRGSIINISSIGGHVALRKTLPYCAAKGGLEQLTKVLAVDWAPSGVRVNSIAPGFVETELTVRVREHPKISQRLLGQTPMGRFCGTDELTGAAVFLASAASSYVTGHSLVVDGGWTAQ
ncbi:glucose 1-dehydrogenase [Azospirillum sp. RWY-5-1]|uniref:Glucose 1-dehydrogenase n=1 Tax=Azospirillum oleiclasticum TaxID=2735135 RepID=A0ABX2TG91_9PROT|nr:glucose 1-dehydrogenase [Azospirillum oleiclasticum]NYZ14397.1 glucose 1-dehydrogenase [Azospirillum oleiclasticum]NYZ23251.1 glucose 1-dehydrogenase [Azospirillum oleiclasticum]